MIRLPRPYRYRAFLLALLLSLLLPAGSAFSAPAVPPTVDRAAAEEAFIAAYGHFLQNRLWSCLDGLAEAQRLNTYYIDTYYLKALAMRRLGRYPDAMEAMRAYLEVRRSDPRGQMILRSMQDEWRLLQETLRPKEVLSLLAFHGNTLNASFGVPMYHRLALYGMTGLGKLSAFGDYVFTPDTLGNNLWVFDAAQPSKMMQIPVAAPVAVLPLSPEEALLIQKGGETQSLEIDSAAGTLLAMPQGRVDANVSDAALVSAALLAVSDRTGQRVAFYSLPALDEVSAWTPDDGAVSGKLFEPVALAAYGPLLAVADRGNGVVYVLDAYTLAVRDRFEVALPRDLAWGNQGELYVLSEGGELNARYPADARATETWRAVSGIPGAWSITWTNDGPIVADVSGRRWWRSGIFPGRSPSVGTVGFQNPWIEGEKGGETLFLQGRVSSIFRQVVLSAAPSSEAVWRGEVRPSLISATGAASKGAIFYYSPAEGEGGERQVRRAGTFDDIWADVAASSRAGEEMPGVIVLDTRVDVPDARIPFFLSFLQHQGIRLDLWARSRPASVMLTYLSRCTLGNTYYSSALAEAPLNDDIEWRVSVPLPSETVSFGYPTDSTLSIFAAVDLIQFNDWIPVWPSLVERKKPKE